MRVGTVRATCRSRPGATSSAVTSTSPSHGDQFFAGPVTFAAPAATTPPPPVDLDLQRHVQLILEDVEFINIRGISSRLGASRNAVRRPIEELYTPLSTHLDDRRDGSAMDLRGERVELPELLPAHRHLLLVGQPGSGKTTFLHLVACMLARDLAGRPPPQGALSWCARHLGLPAGIPTWIPGLVKIALLVPLFFEHSKPGRADDRHWLLDLLALHACAAGTQADPGVRASGHAQRCEQWDLWLRAGRVMLLLDGLDERRRGAARARLPDLQRTLAGPGRTVRSA